jgi:hypothetical protein
MKVGEVGYVPKGQLMLNPHYTSMRRSWKSRPTWRPSIFFSEINEAATGGVETGQGRRFFGVHLDP